MPPEKKSSSSSKKTSPSSQKKELSPESLVDSLQKADLSELKQIASSLAALQKKDDEEIPKNDDELHAWIKDNLGLDIPRVAVCPGHSAPFEPIADLFFGRIDSAIVVANRGGGKTMTASLWNFLNCHFIAEVEAASVGAVEIQSKRAYAHLKSFNDKAEKSLAKKIIKSSLLSETRYLIGSLYEVLTGSKNSVNGPHPQKVHRDEVELMKQEVYYESLQMEKSKINSKGEDIPAQSLVTSTRKTSDGLMQELINECEAAVRENREPPHKIYMYCIKEVAQNQPNCRVAFPDLPEEEKCDCHLVQKGEWDEDKPRTLEHICNGDFAKSQGFTPLRDIKKTFHSSSKAIWEAQQECKRPYIEDISLPNFSRERNGVRGYTPDPNLGPIYMGMDFGGTSPHAIELIQSLYYEVEVNGYDGKPKRLLEGSKVIFDEIYIAGIGNVKLGELILELEQAYKMRFSGFKVLKRFADPQAAIAKLDLKRLHQSFHNFAWPTITRDREEHRKRISDYIDDGLFFVDLDRCPMFCEEVESWNINATKKGFDHAVDAGLYGISNIYAIEAKDADEIIEIPANVSVSDIYKPDPFNDDIPGVDRASEFQEEIAWQYSIERS